MVSFQIRRRSRRRNLAFNSGSRRLETFDFSPTYVPPLPLAGGVSTTTTNSLGAVGTTGDWKFEELMEMDGPSLLHLMYKTQQIHSFLP
jgi:hypothetical protein